MPAACLQHEPPHRHNLSCYPCCFPLLWLRCRKLGKDDNSQFMRCSSGKKKKKSLQESMHHCIPSSSPAQHHALDPQLQLWFPTGKQDYLTEKRWGKSCANSAIQLWWFPYSWLTKRELGMKLRWDMLVHWTALKKFLFSPSNSSPLLVSCSARCSWLLCFLQSFQLADWAGCSNWPRLKAYADTVSPKSLAPLPF